MITKDLCSYAIIFLRHEKILRDRGSAGVAEVAGVVAARWGGCPLGWRSVGWRVSVVGGGSARWGGEGAAADGDQGGVILGRVDAAALDVAEGALGGVGAGRGGVSQGREGGLDGADRGPGDEQLGDRGPLERLRVARVDAAREAVEDLLGLDELGLDLARD